MLPTNIPVFLCYIICIVCRKPQSVCAICIVQKSSVIFLHFSGNFVDSFHRALGSWYRWSVHLILSLYHLFLSYFSEMLFSKSKFLFFLRIFLLSALLKINIEYFPIKCFLRVLMTLSSLFLCDFLSKSPSSGLQRQSHFYFLIYVSAGFANLLRESYSPFFGIFFLFSLPGESQQTKHQSKMKQNNKWPTPP